MNWITVLLHYFYHGIQGDKTRNFVHGETLEVQYEIYRFEALSLKDTLSMFNLHQISAV